MLVWSPLAGGALTGKYSTAGTPPEGARRTRFDFPPVDPQALDRCLRAMRPIADAHGVPVARVALAWLRSRPEVTSVIAGARRQEQPADNLGASGFALAAEELAAIDAAAPPAPLYPHFMVARTATDREPGAAAGLITLRRD